MPTVTVELHDDKTNELVGVVRCVLREGTGSALRRHLLRLLQYHFPEASLDAQLLQPALRERLSDLRVGRDAILPLQVARRPDQAGEDCEEQRRLVRAYLGCLTVIRQGLSQLGQAVGQTLDAEQYRRSLAALRAERNGHEDLVRAVGRELVAAGLTAGAVEQYALQVRALAGARQETRDQLEAAQVDLENLKAELTRLDQRCVVLQQDCRRLEQENQRLLADLAATGPIAWTEPPAPGGGRL